jgi:ADP-heptose:LPS heptosyltransferase
LVLTAEESNVRMGNLLLVTPALAALRQALPHARIDVLCHETYATLLAHDPDVGRVVGRYGIPSASRGIALES